MVAPAAAAQPVIDIIGYGADSFVELNSVSTEQIQAVRKDHSVTWVNISCLGDADLVARVGNIFGLHQLAMEDVLNLHQRPKVEEYADHVFVVTQMYRTYADFGTEQVAIFLGKDYVLSFQEQAGDCLEPLRKRIREAKGRVRRAGADYLCYAILDAVVDEYFPVLERYGETLEDLEEQVITQVGGDHTARLHEMKRDLLNIRRAVWPHREMINTLIRDENPLLSDATRMYLRDIYDHTIQLMDIVETYREITSALVDVYISSVSAKLNEIMKVLTIIATIFIPLSFVASLYGMNFDRSVSPWNMPELGWRYGYPLSLLLMGGIVAGLLLYFRRRGWLGGQDRRR
jgi:magnesium transporter